jgi:adenylyl-sulfate kinase
MERGFTLWFTGLSGAGKTTLAEIVERTLKQRGRRVELLDGDVVRTHLSKGLGFSREDRDINILRIGFVCRLLARNGVIAIASAISPYRETRDQVRAMCDDFVEVYVDTPLEECRRRDVKGLYRQALTGQVSAFTGVSDPYEPPLAAEITVSTIGQAPEQSAAAIISWLERRGYLDIETHAPAYSASAAPAYTIPERVVSESGQNGQNGHRADDALADPGVAYSPDEEETVSARLEALGYL